MTHRGKDYREDLEEIKQKLKGTAIEPPEDLDPICYLFLGDTRKNTTSEFQRCWMPVAGATAFFVASLLSNVTGRMPLRASMHKHVFYTLVGLGIGEGGWKFKERVAAEKDVQYFHYMVLHPEDFRAPERRKWSEVLQPWTPHR